MAVTPIEMSVTSMRGDNVTGTLVELTSVQIVIETPDGNRTLKSADLLRAKSTRDLTAPLPRSENVATVVTLIDGSVLHAANYTVDTGRASITLLDGSDLTVPTRAIDHVRLMKQTLATAEQWLELLQNPRKSDAVVIRKTADTTDDSNKKTSKVALDATEGVLGKIDESTIEFEFGDSSVNVSRGKVEGVIYFHRTTSASRDPVCRVTDGSGSRWNARSLQLKEDGLHAICVSGVRFTIPLAHVDTLDYSVGNIDYLSDLPRESVIWKPRRVAGTPPSAYRWFSPKFDTGLYGSVLKLDDEPYEKGLALHSHAEVTYRLTKRYRSFLARVGVDDGSRYEADLELQIFGDGKVIFTRKITGRDEPFDLELDMGGIRRLKIVVGYGNDDSERGDNLNLCNARLTK